jgi:hypothetical protein
MVYPVEVLIFLHALIFILDLLIYHPYNFFSMAEIKNIIKALEGEESLLLVLPKKVSIDLDIDDQDWLKYELKNGQIIIGKVEAEDLE